MTGCRCGSSSTRCPTTSAHAPPCRSRSSARHAGTRPASLSYLTPGLGWRADYVALFDEADGKIDVQGWVTLTNSSGTTYENAQTLLVAGAPTGSARRRRSRCVREPQPQPRPTLQQAGTESGSRERLGDYYLYPLSERTTIANLQTKQVSFLDVHGVPAEHGYEFRNRWLGTSESAAERESRLQFLDRRARRPRRSAAGGHSAFLSCATTRRAAVHRREPQSTTRRWDRPCRSPPEMRSM